MNLVTLDLYCLDWLCRTIVFACSTSDTSFLPHCRYHEGVLVFRVLVDKANGSGWTVAGTCKTFDIVSVDYTSAVVYDCVSDLNR